MSRSFLPMTLRLIPRAATCVKSHLTRAFTGSRRRRNTEDSIVGDVPVLDISVFRELHVTLANDTERVRGVYAKFLTSSVQRIEELRQQPFAASLKTLHALKGSAGMVGASRLAALAARLQEATLDRETLLAY